MRGWNCGLVCDKMQMPSLTFNGFYPLIWLTSDEKLLFTNIVHKYGNGIRAPISRFVRQGQAWIKNTTFFRASFGLIHVASIPLWGHFWQSLHAWCQQVKDHEHIKFQDHWSRNKHQKNSSGFQVSTDFCLQKNGKEIYSLLQP